MEAAGFQAAVPRWTEERIQARIRAFLSTTDNPSTGAYRSWTRSQSEASPSLGVIESRLGGWVAALQALGVERPRTEWSKSECLDKLEEWRTERGSQPPTAKEWRTPSGGDRPPVKTLIRHFGSWNEAMLAAGFVPRPRSGGRTRS